MPPSFLHGSKNEDCVKVWFRPRKSKLTMSPIFPLTEFGLNCKSPPAPTTTNNILAPGTSNVVGRVHAWRVLDWCVPVLVGETIAVEAFPSPAMEDCECDFVSSQEAPEQRTPGTPANANMITR